MSKHLVVPGLELVPEDNLSCGITFTVMEQRGIFLSVAEVLGAYVTITRMQVSYAVKRVFV